MAAPEFHRSRVAGSPWPGVFTTHIASGRHYGRHAHATYGFGLLVEGAQRSASGRGMVDAYPGDIMTNNPGEVHDGRPLQAQWRGWRMVHMEPAALAAATGSGGDVALARPVIADAPLRRCLQRLLAALDRWQDGRDDELACEELLVQACGRLLARHAAGAPAQRDAPADLEAVRQRIADDLLHAPTLDELAALAGTGKFQLLRRFAAAHGLTPHAWLVQQRNERARHLIARGHALAEAAAAAGFADQSHMTRLFARQFGFTPGAWQRAVRAQ